MTLTPSHAAALRMLKPALPFALPEMMLVAIWSGRVFWKRTGRLNISIMVRRGLIARNPTTRECLITPLGLAALREWEGKQ